MLFDYRWPTHGYAPTREAAMPPRPSRRLLSRRPASLFLASDDARLFGARSFCAHHRYAPLRRVQTFSRPFFERSDPDLNHLTRLGDRICAIVRGTAQFDSKFAAFSDALHQSVNEITQGSDMLWLIQINVALVPQIDLHGRLIAVTGDVNDGLL
jgi:hypothetical protein